MKAMAVVQVVGGVIAGDASFFPATDEGMAAAKACIRRIVTEYFAESMDAEAAAAAADVALQTDKDGHGGDDHWSSDDGEMDVVIVSGQFPACEDQFGGQEGAWFLRK